ncbi:MAG: M56 family metallopeptidase [Cyclobacteriaceae bacterium]
MIRFSIYLLEASVLLAVFYLLYVLILKKETFFNLNRFFLLGILCLSILFPFLSFDLEPPTIAVERSIEEISKFRMSYYEAMSAWEYDIKDSVEPAFTNRTFLDVNSSDWKNYALKALIALYAIGVIVCLSRIFWGLRWIRRMIITYPTEKMGKIKLVRVPHAIAPFSFLNYVFIHDEIVGDKTFHQVITHEKAHVKQRHSIDLIFVQLLAALFWFNPIVWQLIKSLKTTHEYIADSKILTAGYSLVEYQALLLRQLISNNSYGLVHNFNLSFIKKRITMMKNQKSGWSGKVKVALTIASTLLFSAIVVQCNSKIEEQVSPESKAVADFLDGINLAVLPKTGFKFNGDLNHVLKFNIAGDRLTINGKSYEVNQIGTALEKFESSKQGAIVLAIDRDQNMGLIRAISNELRKAERMKILYLGKTKSGEIVEMAIMLPPHPESGTGISLPKIDDAYVRAHNLDLLKVDAGDKRDVALQDEVYGLVLNHVKNGTSKYVVSLKYDDDDTYADYLVSLAYIQAGFDQIYQERALEMFGKDFYALEKEDYRAVRKGIPRAISIAE